MTKPKAAFEGKWGRREYPVPNDAGELIRLPSVSNVQKVLAAPGLEKWKQGIIAEQLARRPDLVMLAGNPSTRTDAIKQALDGDQSAVNVGTSVHFFTEMVDDGTLDWSLIPEAAKPWVHNYAQAKEDFGWELVDKEFTVYNHTHQYAGTADRALRFPGVGVAVADLKSGKSVVSDHALQLAFYAHGEGIWLPPPTEEVDAAVARLKEALEAQVESGVKPDGKKMTQVWQKDQQQEIDEAWWDAFAKLGQRLPMPADLRKDVGFIIHLRENKCELIPMNLEGIEPVIFGMSAIYRWQQRKDVIGKVVSRPETTSDPQSPPGDVPQTAVPGGDMEPTGEVPVSPAPPLRKAYEALRERVVAMDAATRDDLRFNWPAGVPTLKTFNHTATQLEEIDRAIWDIECKHAPVLERKPLDAEDMSVSTVLSTFPGSEVVTEY